MPASNRKRNELRTLLGGFDPPDITITHQNRQDRANRAIIIDEIELTIGDQQGIRGYITRPAGEWRERPAILAIHAHGNRYGIGAAELIEGRAALLDPPHGIALAEVGFVTLCFDLPCFGSRSGESESALAKRYLWQGRSLFGAMLAELEAGIGLLQSLPRVDPQRIGVTGFSMGATLAFWLAALDDRVRAVAHACAFADLATLMRTGAHDLHGPYMTVPGLVPAYRTGEIAGLVAPRPQLACMGLADPLTPEAAVEIALADARRAYQAARAPDHFSTHIDPQASHGETSGMREAMLGFLAKHVADEA